MKCGNQHSASPNQKIKFFENAHQCTLRQLAKRGELAAPIIFKQVFAVFLFSVICLLADDWSLRRVCKARHKGRTVFSALRLLMWNLPLDWAVLARKGNRFITRWRPNEKTKERLLPQCQTHTKRFHIFSTPKTFRLTIPLEEHSFDMSICDSQHRLVHFFERVSQAATVY